MSKISSVLVANRGEIACRIISTCKRLGIRTIAVFSEADRNALHTKLADEAYFIGPSPASESYLNIDKILEVARNSKADAIHPGYGFLSESAPFAESVKKAQIIFIGPTPKNIELAGDKVKAKAIATKLKIPTSPSITVSDYQKGASQKGLKDFATKHGFPLLIKAAAGGGGRGMRKIYAPEEFENAIESAAREAKSFFGDPSLFVEKFLEKARHIEVQVLGDGHGNIVTLGTRDCSLQRNHQKVIEEAPANGISVEVEALLLKYAKDLAQEMSYENAGTVEFLVKDKEIYFLEINSRLQVEHTVTEEIFGIDLVEWQIKIAEGESLEKFSPSVCGHSIQLRLCAENPRENFIAEAGRINYINFPSDSLVRVDSGLQSGGTISPYYDSLMAKIIVRGADRDAAISLARKACGETRILGILTNSEYLQALLASDAYISNKHSTITAGEVKESLTANSNALLAAVATFFAAGKIHNPCPPANSWSDLDFFRFGALSQISRSYDVNGTIVAIKVGAAGKNSFRINESPCSIEFTCDDKIYVSLGIHHSNFIVERMGSTFWANGPSGVFRVKPKLTPLRVFKDAEAHDSIIKSPLPGKVLSVKVKEGQSVAEGETLVTIESMKMEHSLNAPFKAHVGKIETSEGAPVSKDEVLIHLIPEV